MGRIVIDSNETMLGNFNTGDIATRLVWDLIDALGLRGIQLTSAVLPLYQPFFSSFSVSHLATLSLWARLWKPHTIAAMPLDHYRSCSIWMCCWAAVLQVAGLIYIQ